MNDPMPVMMICLAVGVIHLYAGLGMAAYLNFKRGKPLDALYDQFSWIFALTGLGLYALCSGTLQTIGLGLTIFGVALLLLFGGREKKNPVCASAGRFGARFTARRAGFPTFCPTCACSVWVWRRASWGKLSTCWSA